MAAKLDAHEIRALREQLDENEAAIRTLPKWTQAYQAKAEVYQALKKRLDEQEQPSDDLTKSPPALEYTKGDPQSELQAITKRLEILGDGDLTPVYIEHRQTLRQRKDHIEERLPYLNVTSEDLASQVEDGEIELEGLQKQLRELPPITGTFTDSPAAIKATRLRQEAAEKLVKLKTEAAHREAREFGAAAVAQHARTKAQDLAGKAHKESIDRQIEEMKAAGAQAWELRKLQDESVATPPEELVAEFAESIQADMISRMPAADLSLPI
jgi:hypothetical protein